jgi:hypothetical protein
MLTYDEINEHLRENGVRLSDKAVEDMMRSLSKYHSDTDPLDMDIKQAVSHCLNVIQTVSRGFFGNSTPETVKMKEE